jgi:hypothetical protein
MSESCRRSKMARGVRSNGHEGEGSFGVLRAFSRAFSKKIYKTPNDFPVFPATTNPQQQQPAPS